MSDRPPSPDVQYRRFEFLQMVQEYLLMLEEVASMFTQEELDSMLQELQQEQQGEVVNND